MAALVTSRFKLILKDFYQKLLDNGKPKKLALTAVMRKLLCVALFLKNGHPPQNTLSQYLSFFSRSHKRRSCYNYSIYDFSARGALEDAYFKNYGPASLYFEDIPFFAFLYHNQPKIPHQECGACLMKTPPNNLQKVKKGSHPDHNSPQTLRSKWKQKTTTTW